MKDILGKRAKDLVTEQSDLSITPISMDSNIYLDAVSYTHLTLPTNREV